ncbi:MAG TPA: ferric reductase-like transmembrane domain-containing protein [Candidatus Saccharimonadia bacterium]|jgi:predicted ferric reductase
MEETALEMVQRMLGEGKSTEQIRDALSGLPQQETALPILPSGQPTATSPLVAARTGQTAMAAPPGALARALASLGVAPQAGPTFRGYTAPDIIPLSKVASMVQPKSGWIAIVLTCLVPTLALSFDSPDRYANLSYALLTLGDISGIIGLVLYVWGLVLSTRIGLVENMFGGLNRVYVSHAIVGSASLMILLMHPFFSAASYYEYGLAVVAHFFVPQLAYIGSAFGIIALITMIVLLVLTLFVKLAYKLWLSTHRLLGVVYLLIALHIILTPNQVMRDHNMAAFMYGTLIVGALAYIYRTLMPDVFVRRYLYTIQSAVPKASNVVEVTLQPVGKAIHFKPGQFIFLSVNSDKVTREWHPFSVASADTSKSLTLDIRSLGAYTESLNKLLPYLVGSTVRVEGAYGRFSYRNFGNVNQVWIAGGIGITPFLSMAQALGNGPYNIDLYYTVKNNSELIDLEKLAAHQSRRPGQAFRVFPYINDRYGNHLSATFIDQHTGNLPAHDFLLCGPPAMMRSVTSQLVKMGVPEQHIHSEEFGF